MCASIPVGWHPICQPFQYFVSTSGWGCLADRASVEPCGGAARAHSRPPDGTLTWSYSLNHRLGALAALLLAVAIAAAATVATATVATPHSSASPRILHAATAPPSIRATINRGGPTVREGVLDGTPSAAPTGSAAPTSAPVAASGPATAATPLPPAPPTTEVVGIASNYPATAGWDGQATVALPGDLGGRYTAEVNGYVTVCADRCARLPVVDWCQCYWGTADQRVVDLSHAAWALVTDQPLSSGLTEVRLILER